MQGWVQAQGAHGEGQAKGQAVWEQALGVGAVDGKGNKWQGERHRLAGVEGGKGKGSGSLLPTTVFHIQQSGEGEQI